MNNDKILELYKHYRSETMETYRLHRIAIEHYITFVVAILGVTIAGIIQFGNNNGWLNNILLCGPAINILICVVAIGMCKCSYRGALERVTIFLKLEEILKIRNISDITDTETLNSFREDKNLLPLRWIKSAQNFATAEEFVKSNINSGTNFYATLTFVLIIFINIFLAVIILFA